MLPDDVTDNVTTLVSDLGIAPVVHATGTGTHGPGDHAGNNLVVAERDARCPTLALSHPPSQSTREYKPRRSPAHEDAQPFHAVVTSRGGNPHRACRSG